MLRIIVRRLAHQCSCRSAGALRRTSLRKVDRGRQCLFPGPHASALFWGCASLSGSPMSKNSLAPHFECPATPATSLETGIEVLEAEMSEESARGSAGGSGRVRTPSTGAGSRSVGTSLAVVVGPSNGAANGGAAGAALSAGYRGLGDDPLDGAAQRPQRMLQPRQP
jgi:hypothetical protein